MLSFLRRTAILLAGKYVAFSRKIEKFLEPVDPTPFGPHHPNI